MQLTGPFGRRTFLASTAAAVASLTACGGDAFPPTPPSPPGTSSRIGLLARHGFDGQDARQIIDQLDRMPRSGLPEGLSASVTPQALTLSDDTGEEVVVPMPGNAFYVSIAPYVTSTHECFHHSLTGCLGELRNEPVSIEVQSPEGSFPTQVDRPTFDNGFVGQWLPRGYTGRIRIRRGDLAGVVDVATTDDSPTCITTLRLT